MCKRDNRKTKEKWIKPAIKKKKKNKKKQIRKIIACVTAEWEERKRSSSSKNWALSGRKAHRRSPVISNLRRIIRRLQILEDPSSVRLLLLFGALNPTATLSLSLSLEDRPLRRERKRRKKVELGRCDFCQNTNETVSSPVFTFTPLCARKDSEIGCESANETNRFERRREAELGPFRSFF